MESALSRALRGVYDDLVRFETELWDTLDGLLRTRHGISLGTFEFLQVVDRTEDCRVQDVAAAIAITVGGASKFVDRMETAGQLTRAANPRDRRSSLLRLTPEGARLLTEAGRTFDDALRARLAFVVTADELAALGNTLRKLRAALEAAPEGTS